MKTNEWLVLTSDIREAIDLAKAHESTHLTAIEPCRCPVSPCDSETAAPYSYSVIIQATNGYV